MVSVSSSTAALCPQSYATMAPCTECDAHHADPSNPTSRPLALPFPTSMTYQHASSSRILTPAQAARLYPDDEEAQEAARFWANSQRFINDGYRIRCSDAEWAALPTAAVDAAAADGVVVACLDDVDDDSRSDLGAPEVGEETWSAPPPAYCEKEADARTRAKTTAGGTWGDLSPRAGTLCLTVNASIVPPSPPSSTSSAASSSSSSCASPSPRRAQPAASATAPATPPKRAQPSFLSLTFLGPTRAHARAQRHAERRAAHLEELHDAWARLGLNTREMLARGGEGALPPHFEHPPRCGLDDMLGQLSL